MNEIIKDLFYIFLVVVAVWLAFYFGTRHDTLQQRMMRYDCSIVEFAPDIPNDVRDECRNRRIQQLNKDKE